MYAISCTADYSPYKKLTWDDHQSGQEFQVLWSLWRRAVDLDFPHILPQYWSPSSHCWFLITQCHDTSACGLWIKKKKLHFIRLNVYITTQRHEQCFLKQQTGNKKWVKTAGSMVKSRHFKRSEWRKSDIETRWTTSITHLGRPSQRVHRGDQLTSSSLGFPTVSISSWFAASASCSSSSAMVRMTRRVTELWAVCVFSTDTASL